jgi:hypothetical protein
MRWAQKVGIETSVWKPVQTLACERQHRPGVENTAGIQAQAVGALRFS